MNHHIVRLRGTSKGKYKPIRTVREEGVVCMAQQTVEQQAMAEEKVEVDGRIPVINELRTEKRDGRLEEFDQEKINHAIRMAWTEVNGDLDAESTKAINDITDTVASRVKSRYTDIVRISEIQNVVEHALIDEAHWYDVARAYVDYRLEHDMKRAQLTDVNYAVKRFSSNDKSIMNENANKDSRQAAVRRDLLAGAVSKSFAFKQLPRDVSNAFAKKDIHYHDADYSPFTTMNNCSLPNYGGMLASGFNLGNAQMGSPKSIGTATSQVAQIMLDVAGNQYGGQTIDRADQMFAPYAEKDYRKFLNEAELVLPDGIDIDTAKSIVSSFKNKENSDLHIPDSPVIHDEPAPGITDPLEQQRDLYAKIRTRKAIYDAFQGLEYNLNSQHSSCGQVPFTSIGFGLGESWVEREITRCILLVRIAGLGENHKTAIFPKLLYTIKHGVNSEPSDPNYDLKQLALECTSKRMYPDILFYENIVDITGDFKAPMGCRSFLQAWRNPETGENEIDGRMNLGVVTVNLPRIALESRDRNGTPNLKRFWRIFDKRMDVIHHALQFRIKRCMEAVPESAPSLWEFGAFGRLDRDGDVSSLMRNGRATASLGYVGVYETVAVFYGRDWVNDDGWDMEAYEFAKEIMQKLNDYCHEWEEADPEHIHYSVYGTPAESTSSSFINADKAKFGEIKGITDKEWYTNSFHRPTWISGNGGWSPEPGEEDVRLRPTFHKATNGGVASKLDFEAPLEKLSPGGNVVMIDLPRLIDNTKALEAVWNYAHDVGVGYLLSNCPIDRCTCGFAGDAIATDTGYRCPECGNTDPETLDCVKRVCGYLGEPIERPMVKGRDHEIKSRKLNMAGRTGEMYNDDEVGEAFYSTDRL